MATEVRHGPRPRFKTKLTGGSFDVLITGYYTVMPRRGAGGVSCFTFNSRQPAKRLNELLVLRTCFLEWYLQQWIRNKGKRREGIAQVRKYPFKRKY